MRINVYRYYGWSGGNLMYTSKRRKRKGNPSTKTPLALSGLRPFTVNYMPSVFRVRKASECSVFVGREMIRARRNTTQPQTKKSAVIMSDCFLIVLRLATKPPLQHLTKVDFVLRIYVFLWRLIF